ncbi:hypothetical protein [Bacillus ndiopicus]|uniref:hypothetical protein n=1 Tax=Bacillus ndiopicus TaxID=1347368 RepID=UPI0005AAAC23|nr:hypothetical protein [Bacillus ndiopicus]
MTTVIVFFILSIPIYFLMFRSYKNPKESILWGRRWTFKEQPEVSEAAVNYVKITSLFGIIVISAVFFFLFLSQI